MAYTPQDERERRERKNRRVTIAVSVFIILTLVLSTIGFYFSGTQNTDENKNPEYDYGGIKFVQVNNVWTFSTSQGQGTATFLPALVKDIKCVNCGELSRNYLRTENSKAYVVAFTQKETLAVSELFGSIQLYTNTQRACLQEQENDLECLDLPLKSCKSTSDKVFIFKEENETQVIKQENCLFIKGNSSELVKAADRAIYQIYGVLK